MLIKDEWWLKRVQLTFVIVCLEEGFGFLKIVKGILESDVYVVE